MEEDNKCPLCGKNIENGDSFCHDCQEIAKTSDLSGFLADENQEKEISDHPEKATETEQNIQENINENTQDNQNENIKNKSNKKLYIFISIMLILIICTGAVGSYIFLNNKYTEETEISYWNKCFEENTPLSYSKYLVQYPNGKYSEEAQNKILELREAERNEWEKLKKTNDIDAFFAFVTDHPRTPYISEIKRITDSLSWQIALKENTKEAYMAYIDNVKLRQMTGDYVDLALDKYNYLSQLVTIEGVELKYVKASISDFFKSVSSTNVKDMEKLTTPLLAKFFDSENKNSKQIIDSLKNDMKSKNIKKVTYTPSSDLQDAIRDNQNVYFIKVSVRKEVSFSNRKKKKENSDYILNIILDENKKVYSISKN
ncbi:MAG: hypothetical protein E6767_19765 [Dysgonomonas sp.]|nr:hypothetical protein [Dysgonomonas sp.]